MRTAGVVFMAEGHQEGGSQVHCVAPTCGFPCDKPCVPIRKGMGFGACTREYLSGAGLALVIRLKQIKRGLDVTRDFR